jgi:hypothetical protein
MLTIRRPTSTLVDTVRLNDLSGQFALGPLLPGLTSIEVRSLGYGFRTIQRTLEPGKLDTVAVRLSGASGLIEDCICRDGHSFGGRCCPPRTVETCRVTDSA